MSPLVLTLLAATAFLAALALFLDILSLAMLALLMLFTVPARGEAQAEDKSE